jgi:hypothetical protein
MSSQGSLLVEAAAAAAGRREAKFSSNSYHDLDLPPSGVSLPNPKCVRERIQSQDPSRMPFAIDQDAV